jgi:hypothetical protein
MLYSHSNDNLITKVSSSQHIAPPTQDITATSDIKTPACLILIVPGRPVCAFLVRVCTPHTSWRKVEGVMKQEWAVGRASLLEQVHIRRRVEKKNKIWLNFVNFPTAGKRGCTYT